VVIAMRGNCYFATKVRVLSQTATERGSMQLQVYRLSGGCTTFLSRQRTNDQQLLHVCKGVALQSHVPFVSVACLTATSMSTCDAFSPRMSLYVDMPALTLCLQLQNAINAGAAALIVTDNGDEGYFYLTPSSQSDLSLTGAALGGVAQSVGRWVWLSFYCRW
jgi:hypothetical protein